jgi:2-methylcitrate dehydratase PrpD
MPGEIKHSRRTVLRAVREAFPAQAAVLSALLARDGVAGFESPLEGEAGFFRLFADGSFDVHDLTAGLGERFHIERLSFKPWPACRGTHACIEIALDLLQEHGIHWRDIESVTAGIGEVQRMLVEPLDSKRAPQTVIDAKFSIPFTVAVALVHGDVNLASFEAAMLEDADVLGMAQRVNADNRPDWGREHAAAGALTLKLRDGRALHGTVDQARGHPDSPLSAEQLLAKFMHCCAHAARPIDATRARVIARRLLETGDSDNSGELFFL